MVQFTAEHITDRITKIFCPGNVCAFLAEGDEKAALIDTGFGAGSIRQYVETLTDLPLTVILTHGHYDHSGGAGEFAEAYIHENDIPLALAHSQKAVRMAALPTVGVSVEESELPEALLRSQLRTYEAEEEFDLGGLVIRMLPLFGHTAGMCCPLFVNERIVLLGDACNSAAFMQLEECLPLSEYQENLKAFKEKYESLYDTLIYSHPHNFGSKQIVQEMIDLIDQVTAPGFEGISMEAMLGPGIKIAKGINEYFAPLDGTCANLVYTDEKTGGKK